MRRRLPLAAALSAGLVLLLGGTASSFSPAPISTWVASGGSVQAVAVSGSTAYLGGDFDYVGPATGSFVSVDTSSGALTTPWPLVGGDVSAVVADGQGGWFIGGSFATIGKQRVDNLAHIASGGTLDTAWTGSVDGPVSALLLDGGRLYVGGAFSAARSGDDPAGARVPRAAFVSATGAVTSFDPFPSMSPNAISIVSALALSGATLYVGGFFETIGAAVRTNLAAVDTTNGTLTSWDPVVDDSVNSISIGPTTGTVYVAGFFATATTDEVDRAFAAAFTPAGVLTSWDPELSAPVYAVKATSSTVYLGGDFSVLGNDDRAGLASVDPSTGAATIWDPSVHGIVNTLQVSGTTVYAGGRFQRVGGSTARDNLAAFD